MRPFSILVSCLIVWGCQSAPAQPENAEPKVNATAAPAAKRYGEPISAGSQVALTELIAKPAEYRDKSVIVEADVRRACTRKGCWMELANGMDKSKPGCRVTFKDYGFFVPTDSAGAKARVQGVVRVETLKAGHVEHLEEEGASFPHKNADGTVNEVQLVATGVELSK